MSPMLCFSSALNRSVSELITSLSMPWCMRRQEEEEEEEEVDEMIGEMINDDM